MGTVFPEPPGALPPGKASESPWPGGRLAEVHSEGDSTQRKLDARVVGTQSRATLTLEFGVLGNLDGWPLVSSPSSSAFLQESTPPPHPPTPASQELCRHPVCQTCRPS